MEEGDLVIARVMHGSMIDRQGMLHAGDVIREVNGREVGKDPMALQHMLRDCNGGITLKILPSYRDTPPPAQVSTPLIQSNEIKWYKIFKNILPPSCLVEAKLIQNKCKMNLNPFSAARCGSFSSELFVLSASDY